MRNRRVGALLAGLLVLAATACYQDFDFSADHKADFVFVESNGAWHDLATDNLVSTMAPGDWPVPADWNGDHLFDPAVVEPDGDWVTGAAAGTFSFPKPAELPAFVGANSFTMLPVPADYDGDGDADAAWYRESDATWFIRGRTPIQFGSGPRVAPGGSGHPPIDQLYDYDFPVPADYDGDGTDDLSTFNPRTQAWAVRSSADGTVSTVSLPGNELLPMPVPADYDGVGHAQRAVFGSNGWLIEGHAQLDPYGAYVAGVQSSGWPAVADYDGDNRADLSYVDFDTGLWHTKGSDVTYDTDARWYDGAWPVVSGWNLRANIARLTLLGRCVALGNC